MATVDAGTLVSNKQLKLPAESLKDNPFTVYIHVNTEGGIEVNADEGANFYAVVGAIEGARALMRCCVIDGYTHDRKQREQQENSNELENDN